MRMDKPITLTPVPDKELAALIDKADKVYWENFNGDTWFGRCIFLSFYCELGTCTFCFRSTQKKNIKNPQKARRSLASVLSEALLIKGLGWRIEFLTGGYGIMKDEELLRVTKLVKHVFGQDEMWVNLGEIGTEMLDEFKPYVQGIYSSIETVNPQLHKTVCPDKPIQPYVEMIERSPEFKHGMAIIIGLGETREDWDITEEFIRQNGFKRVTVYALRPVGGTPFTKGPDSLEVAWWIAKMRIAFPKMEIIAGSAKYRIPELSLFLKAGANGITKLPATNIFNKKEGVMVEEEVKKAGRTFISKFSCPDIHKEADWEGMINALDLTDEEKEKLKTTLYRYLDNMSKQTFDSCEL